MNELTKIDVEQGLERIKNLFGGFYGYTGTQTDILQRNLKYLSSQQWIQIVDNTINVFEKLPTLKQIIDQARTPLRAAKDKRLNEILRHQKESNISPCKYCNNSGVIDAYMISGKNLQLYAFRCGYCEFQALFSLSKSIKIWSDDLKEFFKFRFELDQEEIVKMTKDIYRILKREKGHTFALKAICRLSDEEIKGCWSKFFNREISAI